MLTFAFVLAVLPPAPSDVEVAAATSSDWLMLLLYAALAIGVSFLCSLLEAGLLSLPAAHVRVMESRGSKAGRRLAEFKAAVDRPLAAILTLNTVAHTVGAAGVGAQILIIFGSKAVAIGSALITLLILVLSEIIPKSLGAAHAKRLAPFTAVAVQGMIYLTLPLLIPLQWISRALGGGEVSALSRDEVAVMAELGEDSGALQPQESRVIRNLLRLSKITVHDVMTPRPVMFTLAADATVAEVRAAHPTLRFSRIPLTEGDADHIVGMVTRHKLMHVITHEGNKSPPLRELADALGRVSETASVAESLDRMIAQQQQMLLVTDEFGGTEGLVTLEDCIETLLGVEIVDETDTVDDLRQAAHDRLARRRDKMASNTE